MNSKEALEKLFNDIKQFEEHFVGCICNDTKEEYNLIKKDLEVLDILKRNIFVADNTIYATPNELEKDDYKKLKEWYENGKIN